MGGLEEGERGPMRVRTIRPITFSGRGCGSLIHVAGVWFRSSEYQRHREEEWTGPRMPRRMVGPRHRKARSPD